MRVTQPAHRPPDPVTARAVRVVDPPDWDAVVDRLTGLDTYTSSAYHRVSALLEPAGTRPVLLHSGRPGGEWALPLLLRPLPDASGWEATSAYGYGGPVTASPHGRDVFLAELDEWARGNAVVTTFLRLHPLLGNAALVRPADRVAAGSTVAWDISPGRDLVAGMHAHHRRVLRRADRAPLEVSVVSGAPNLDEFRALYETTMRRQGAGDYYFFGDDYWQALDTEAEELGLVLVEGRLGGELAAGLLCLAHGGWLHYHLGASSDAGRDVGASTRCFVTAARWGQARGMSTFHLGGGVGGAGSSLFVFKSRFDPGAAPLPFHVVKLVHDQPRYRQRAGTDSTAGFFPPWRGVDR